MNKKQLMIITLIATLFLVFCIADTVSAYNPTYEIKEDKIIIDFNPNSTMRNDGIPQKYQKNIIVEQENGKNLRSFSFECSDSRKDYVGSAGIKFGTMNLPRIKYLDIIWLNNGNEIKERQNVNHYYGEFINPGSRIMGGNELNIGFAKYHNYANDAFFGFYKSFQGENWIKASKVTITFEGKIIKTTKSSKPDLTITKIKKFYSQQNTKNGKSTPIPSGKVGYDVYVKNIGSKTAFKPQAELGVYVGSKLITKIRAYDGLPPGDTYSVKVLIDKKYANKVKTFKVDITNKVNEKSKKNNSKNFK